MASLPLIKKLHKSNLFHNGVMWKRGFTQFTNRKRKGVQGLVSIGKAALKHYNNKLLTPKYTQIRELKVSSTNKTDDDCGTKSSSDTCHREKPKKPKCEPVKIPKWTGQCMKVCLPCCVPIDVPLSCEVVHASLNMCKSVNFKYPSYSETINKLSLYDGRRDCCYDPKCLQIVEVGIVATKTKLKDVQKQKLGVPKTSTRFFSTNARAYSKEETKKSDFQKPLPCLKKTEEKGAVKKQIKSKEECKKLCMPCCKPARDPPECFFPYIKPPCKRLRAPRPAFSECQADKTKIPEPCECAYVILPRCDLSKKEDGKEKCAGKGKKK